ncbi:hypothetical protein LUZ60_011772 [Juncus effusus]|nr:hypothetical protein LUZ60_011772 [Juncus effusus]
MASTMTTTRSSVSLTSYRSFSPSLPFNLKRKNSNKLHFRPRFSSFALPLTTVDSSILLPLALVLQEPSNALSLPTWAVHVSSVVEWITAMALVWQYGEKSGHTAWKGLSWGMVPLLGGAMCACTWHFFYNSESLEILVAIQGALTTIGNITMMIAAFRIYKASGESSSNS